MISTESSPTINLISNHHKLAKATDLAIARNWMEQIELNNSEGPGVYDVLRCDLIKEYGRPTTFKVWGQEFHLNRLKNSFHSKFRAGRSDDKEETRIANEQSMSIISALLSKMLEHERGKIDSIDSKNHEVLCEIFRISLLWTPAGYNNIIVRGHASISGDIMVPYQTPALIVATVALPKDKLLALPDRREPHIKLSSWSRSRRPLENRETFMPDGVEEVLLLHENQSTDSLKRYEVLEGLTSNFFVIYTDGTIRTANDHVLLGYIRHLVIQFAPGCGLTLDDRPINLDDGRQGLWAETFITSSSRLIYPIKKILIPDYDGDSTNTGNNRTGLNWKVLWEVESSDNTSTESIEPKWSILLKEILKYGGY